LTRPAKEDRRVELDAVLRVLSSPTRREILSRLVTETHYPLQLSRELGVSQQAIMKHMKVLEEAGLVRGVAEPSDQGGPPRTAFKLTSSLTIAIDLGPSLFSAQMEVHEDGGRNDGKRAGAVPEGPREALAMRLAEVSREISDIGREVAHLDHRRAELVERKMRLLDDAHKVISAMTDEYLSRRILYWVTETDEFSVPLLSERFNLRERVAQELYRDMLRAHLVPESKIRRLR